MKNNNFSFAFAGALIVLAICAAAAWPKPVSTPKAGSATDNKFVTTLTSGSVTIGHDIDTVLVATNTARVYLEIGNDGTSTPQALFCNTNGNAAVIYSGFYIPASTTKIFDLDNLYQGALHCKFQSATSSVTIIEQ